MQILRNFLLFCLNLIYYFYSICPSARKAGYGMERQMERRAQRFPRQGETGPSGVSLDDGHRPYRAVMERISSASSAEA